MNEGKELLPFEPAKDVRTGLRGGPLLPADVSARLNLDEATEIVGGEPNRYSLIYSETTPTGQRLALGIGILGLQNTIPIISLERGRLESPRDRVWHWGPRLSPSVVREMLRDNARMPVLVGPNGLASNDPYRTLLELSRAASQLDVLYPQDLAHEQAHWTRRIFHELHVAVYRAGEEKDQQSYENAVTTVETFLCDLNDHLFGRETLLGTRLTDADIWLYCLLVRFDQVYAPAFRLHRYRLRDFASIRRYCKNLYAQPLFTATTSFAAISEGYYRGVPFLNRGVVPLGPDDLFLL